MMPLPGNEWPERARQSGSNTSLTPTTQNKRSVRMAGVGGVHVHCTVGVQHAPLFGHCGCVLAVKVRKETQRTQQHSSLVARYVGEGGGRCWWHVATKLRCTRIACPAREESERTHTTEFYNAKRTPLPNSVSQKNRPAPLNY